MFAYKNSGEPMAFCINCFKKIESMYEPCPHCGAPPIKKSQPDPTEERKLLMKKIEEAPAEEREELISRLEIDRIMKRGIECYLNGKAWLAVKDRDRARKEFQRALKYFDRVLKIDSTNRDARDFRAKASQKIL